VLEALLQQIAAWPGVDGVVLSDSEGEPIYAYGQVGEDRLQLLGAYQGILMSTIARMLETIDRTLVTVCDTGSILTHHLKDGYFISVILSPKIHFAEAEFHLEDLYPSLVKEL
jgi:hypothetical protein